MIRMTATIYKEKHEDITLSGTTGSVRSFVKDWGYVYEISFAQEETFGKKVRYFDVLSSTTDYNKISVDGEKIIWVGASKTANTPIETTIRVYFWESFIELDRRNMISLEVRETDRGDFSMPNYGIVSNGGSAEFNDKDGSVLQYAERGDLVEKMPVEIFIKDTIKKTEIVVGTLFTEKWNYDNNIRVVSVSLKDNLEEWQDIQVGGIDYDPRSPYKYLPNGSFADIYKWLHKRTPSKYGMVSYNELSEETKSVLEKTKLGYPFLDSSNLWRQWSKVCTACALYIHKNREGKTVCEHRIGG